MANTTTPAVAAAAPRFISLVRDWDNLSFEQTTAKWREMDATLGVSLSEPTPTFFSVEAETGEWHEDDSAVCDFYWFLDEASARSWAAQEPRRCRIVRHEARQLEGRWQPTGRSYERQIIKGFWN
jgi:hypothetical protein